MTSLSSHILDTSLGKPAIHVEVVLYKMAVDGLQKTLIATEQTNADGRITSFTSESLETGSYRLIFKINDYFKARHEACFYPAIAIDFFVDESSEHYHIPLLVSPYGYSTYRGS